jgi:hypothetical protein
MDKYVTEFKEELNRQVAHLGIKRDYLKYMLENDTLVDSTEENKAKVKLDIDILDKKVKELQLMLLWMES